ncbi:MAG: phosphoesterase [Methanomicrobiales archaeon]|nr:phosphoesterase [Methanomicrobiales archaeon]MDI6875256.1 phosphoesterase [Methanomicrobiales archaeon]
MSRSKEKESGLEDALVSRRCDVVHLTHNDLDAVGADAIHRMRYGEIFTVFSSVGTFPQLFQRIAGVAGRGHLLSISDLGYQQGIEKAAEKAVSNGWRIEWRDHHRWEDEEVQRIRGKVGVLHVDTELCACGIVARDLLPHDGRALEVAEVVCDYDLWKNRDPRAAILARVLTREENREYVRDCLIRGIFSDERIEQQFHEIDREMQAMIDRSMRDARIYENKYRIAFTPLYGHPSETAYALRERYRSDIEIIVSPSGRFSIRSVPPISHLIARQFRGGGHPHAAGGNFSFNLIDRAIFWLFKRTRHFNRLAKVANSI